MGNSTELSADVGYFAPGWGLLRVWETQISKSPHMIPLDDVGIFTGGGAANKLLCPTGGGSSLWVWETQTSESPHILEGWGITFTPAQSWKETVAPLASGRDTGLTAPFNF